MPKGTKHVHISLIATAELYGQGVLGIREDDVVYSAAKLFFAYGLGNAMSFPMSVGATAVLLPGRPTPDAVFELMRRERPDDLLRRADALRGDARAQRSAARRRAPTACACASRPARRCPPISAPSGASAVGVDILDGIGSTEMLHIFLCNRAGRHPLRLVGQAGARL